MPRGEKANRLVDRMLVDWVAHLSAHHLQAAVGASKVLVRERGVGEKVDVRVPEMGVVRVPAKLLVVPLWVRGLMAVAWKLVTVALADVMVAGRVVAVVAVMGARMVEMKEARLLAVKVHAAEAVSAKCLQAE